MLDYFPKYFSTRGIIWYIVTLALVSALFINHVMPFQFMLFGLFSVIIFFQYSNKLSMGWRRFSSRLFTKKLFITALVIRIVYVVFIYFYYIEMNGEPHGYHAGDELDYQSTAVMWHDYGFDTFWDVLLTYYAFSDRGYIVWLSFEYILLGTNVLPARILKCFIDAFACVLIYNLAKRNFGETVGRMAAIFCMLMSNMWFYCGVTLKETEMAFLVILFTERADMALHSSKITLRNILLPGLIILVMFTFRTALATVLVAALVGSIILSSGKQMPIWKKVLYSSIFVVWMLLTVGAEMIQETQQLWENKDTNQEASYAWRAERQGGNTFAQYATASIFAPLIFTIPFSSMVEVKNQELQMMMNGGNFIKNCLSGFVIYAMITLLLSGKWRQHVLPIAVTCGYLIVLVFSNFAHSERFHFPVLALELMFAAYGVTLVTNKHKRWFAIWMVGVCIANIIWAWIKLAGRGMA